MHKIFRYYTFTLKATEAALRGDPLQVSNKFNTLVAELEANVQNYVMEDPQQMNVHIHALLCCPKIESYKLVAQKHKGWHLHFEMIKKKEEDTIPDIWIRYINKATSTSVMYDQLYGNMFK